MAHDRAFVEFGRSQIVMDSLHIERSLIFGCVQTIVRCLGHIATCNCASFLESESSLNGARPTDVFFKLPSYHEEIDETGSFVTGCAERTHIAIKGQATKQIVR